MLLSFTGNYDIFFFLIFEYLVMFTQERVAAGLLGRVSPWDPPTVITGGPGAGKTVLASAVARRSDVRRHFRYDWDMPVSVVVARLVLASLGEVGI